jgi:hypothetical protein
MDEIGVSRSRYNEVIFEVVNYECSMMTRNIAVRFLSAFYSFR